MPLVELTVSGQRSLHIDDWWPKVLRLYIFLFETTGNNVLGGSWPGRQKIQGSAQLANMKHLVVLFNWVFIPSHSPLKNTGFEVGQMPVHCLQAESLAQRRNIPNVSSCSLLVPTWALFCFGFHWGPSADPTMEHSISGCCNSQFVSPGCLSIPRAWKSGSFGEVPVNLGWLTEGLHPWSTLQEG